MWLVWLLLQSALVQNGNLYAIGSADSQGVVKGRTVNKSDRELEISVATLKVEKVAPFITSMSYYKVTV